MIISCSVAFFPKDVELAYVCKALWKAEQMERILKARGHKVELMDETAKLNTLIDLKNRTLGRKAIGLDHHGYR